MLSMNVTSRLISISAALMFCFSVCEPAVCRADHPSIAEFTLANHRGTEWSLSDVSDSKLVVIAFLGTECPLAKLYGPRLEELQTQFAARSVAFVGINSNTQDSMTEITAYVAKHKISFPMLKDVGNRVADQFAAKAGNLGLRWNVLEPSVNVYPSSCADHR